MTMDQRVALVIKLLTKLGPPLVTYAVKKLLKLGVVKHVGGKLIVTQAGRYVGGTLGGRALGLALSGPLSIVLMAIMLGVDVYRFTKG
jgi:hypothetical protein